jgi:hypothetical protein
VLGLEEHSVETVLDVMLGEEHRAELGVRVTDIAEDSVQSSSELHGLGRGMWSCGLVDRVPGVVTEESWSAVALILDSGRRQLEGRQVTDPFVRQDYPKPAVDEVGHFFAEKLGVLGSGLVAPAFYTGVKLVVGPCFGRGEYGDSVVSPVTKESGCRMADVVQVGGQVGAPTEGRDEFFPGGRRV